MKVPMNDLKLQNDPLRAEIEAAFRETMGDSSFVLGGQVERFEEAYARYLGVAHCVGVSNGTDAIKLALHAAGVGPGDEVITTPLTFAGTVEAICAVGARPVFVDIEERHFTLDASQVEQSIGAKTRALMPVHLYGQVADMAPLLRLAEQYGLCLVEDAAQAQGARYWDRKAGAIGDVGCFSFYPGKNIGACGDAGCVTTDSGELADRARELRNHGQDAGRRFWYREVGYNNRMDGFQGGVLAVKLPHLDEWNQRRRRLARLYREGLADVGEIVLPREAEYAHHVYHQFVIRAADRDALAAHLGAQGVSTDVHYPFPLHLTAAYRRWGRGEGSLPVCERVCGEIMSLPVFPDLSEVQVEYAIDRIRGYYQDRLAPAAGIANGSPAVATA